MMGYNHIIYIYQYNHLTLLGFNIDSFSMSIISMISLGFAVPRERRRSLAPSSRRLGAVAKKLVRQRMGPHWRMGQNVKSQTSKT